MTLVEIKATSKGLGPEDVSQIDDRFRGREQQGWTVHVHGEPQPVRSIRVVFTDIDAANGSHQGTLDDLFAKYNVNTLEALHPSQKSSFRAHLDGYKPSLYEAATRTSVVLVQEREVCAAEMSIAAATRVHQIFDEPVDQVRFVYFDEAMARKQLPELWLRGLEVHVMTPSGERRIDTAYEPPAATVPDWVMRAGG